MSKIRTPYTLLLALIAIMISATTSTAVAQRKITPVNTPQTATQPINEFEGDTARINARIRATMAHYHDENGNIVYIDTVTGREWRDSTAIKITKKPMQYPLLQSVSVGVDIWNPLMRAFGQHYGLIDFSAQLSLHNRYKPIFETGIGMAKNTPDGNNFTYKSPMSMYVRLGMDYNFLYNSTPDYQYFAGIRFGFSKFSYSIEDITINSTYWDDPVHPSLPSQSPFVSWYEFVMGLKVNLWGPISAGWTFRFHGIAHESKTPYGKPWYIPGFGSRNGVITGSFTISYTFDLNKKTIPSVNPSEPEILIPTPETDDPYAPGITSSTSEEEQAQPVSLN